MAAQYEVSAYITFICDVYQLTTTATITALHCKNQLMLLRLLTTTTTTTTTTTSAAAAAAAAATTAAAATA